MKDFLLLSRRVAAFCLRKVQRLSLYKRIAGFLCSDIEIKEAEGEEGKEFYGISYAKGGFQRNSNVTDFLAKKGTKLIGFVQLVRNKGEYWRYSLIVKPFYRGIGIGEKLCRAVSEKAKAEGAKELYLRVREDNYRAIKLNNKLGFEKTVIPALEKKLKEKKQIHGHKYVIMKKKLVNDTRKN